MSVTTVPPLSGFSKRPGIPSWLLARTPVFWVAMFLVVIIVVFGFLTDGIYVSFTNFQEMAANASVLIIVSVGMTFLLGARELDLSVGANIVLCQLVAAKLIVGLSGSVTETAARIYPNLGLGLTVGLSAALLTGTLVGIANGLLVTKLRVNSFIVTLGMLGILQGAALVVSGGVNVQYIPRQLQTEFASLGLFGVIPAQVVVMAIVATVGGVVLKRTRYGLRTLALGSDRQAAVRAGLKVNRYVISLFALVGFCCGIAAILDMARFGATNLGGYSLTALSAITAVVLGGTSLFGGQATVLGSVLGDFIPVTLSTGLIIMATDPAFQLAVVGALLIISVSLDQLRRRGNL